MFEIKSKEDFLEMVRDWQTDHSPEYDDLAIAEPEIEAGKWTANAKDSKCLYKIIDVDGNIYINYLSTI